MNKRLDLMGQRFDRLIVIATAPKMDGGKNSAWLCRCDCGTAKIIRTDVLRKGMTRSCGCFQRETTSKLMTTHGMSKTGEYRTWHAMKKRCLDTNHPTFQRYGAKGITICQRWRDSFDDFYEDMGPRPSKKHSLDRIENKRGYFPENCRWATTKMQGRNTSKNRMVMIDGVELCVADWCDLMDIDRHKPYNMLYWNKRSGISSIDEAVRVLYGEWNHG